MKKTTIQISLELREELRKYSVKALGSVAPYESIIRYLLKKAGWPESK